MLQQVRKIGPTRRSVSGQYPFRGEMMVPYESSLERDFIRIQEYDSRVERVIAQPVRLSFQLGLRTYTYTPDFLVYMKPECTIKGFLVEVKPESEWRAHWRSWLPKWKSACRWAWAQQMVFHIADESRIRNEVLHNIIAVQSFRHRTQPTFLVQQIMITLALGALTITELARRIHIEVDTVFLACKILLARRLLTMDWREPLDIRMKVWLP